MGTAPVGKLLLISVGSWKWWKVVSLVEVSCWLVVYRCMAAVLPWQGGGIMIFVPSLAFPRL